MKTTIKNIVKPIFFLFSILFFQNSNAQYTKLLDFDGATYGSNPHNSLISDGTYLYGTTEFGGSGNNGTLFKILPNGTGFARLINFNGTTNGRNPRGSLVSVGTFLYGMTYGGGVNNLGCLFKIMPNGTLYEKLLDFDGTNGNFPWDSLISDGTSLYGMTFQGGANGVGIVFKILTNGTGYAKLFDFDGVPNGDHPIGSLISDGTFLYGMTNGGGADINNGSGTLFKIMTNGSGYSKLIDFAVGSTNGSSPFGSLISDGTFLYGMTSTGGTNNKGIIFKIMPDGTGFAKLLDFAGTTNGSIPLGSLIYDGTFLYGMTAYGGINNLGTLFKIMPDGTGYVKLIDFDGAINGSEPNGSLISNGKFLYGMTSTGGTKGLGTLFKFQLSVLNIADHINTLGFSVYPNPVKNILTIQNPKNLSLDKLTITDLTGKKVLEQNGIANPINISQLQQGVYLLQIKSEGYNSNLKFIKQ